MKVPNLPDRTDAAGFNLTYFDRQWGYLVQAINGVGIDNFEGSGPVTLTTPPSPNTDFTVPHKLGRVPIGWLLLSIDAAGIVYKGSVAWTSSMITLRCSTASTNVLLLVV